MADENKWTVDRLDGSNWDTWKFQMKHLLLAKDLWECVEGEGGGAVVQPETAEAKVAFRKRCQKAFSTLVMAIGTSKLYLVSSLDKPDEAWRTLRNHFERDTLANKLFLKKQYFRSEMREGTSMEDHLKQMKEITDRLASIGAPVAEEDQVVTLLGSLPRSYSTLVTALEARVEEVSLGFIQQALIHEEQKQSGLNEKVPSVLKDAALMGSQQLRGRQQKKQIRCYYCNEIGHFRRNCPKESGAHAARTAGMTESDTDDFVFVASKDSAVSSPMEQWLVDSGASSHMTREQTYFTDYRKFDKPEKVGLGDGRTVEAVGIGNIRLKMKYKTSPPNKARLSQVLHVPQLACNLFSVRAAVSNGNTVKFGDSRCWIRAQNGKLCGMGTLTEKLYALDCEPIAAERTAIASEVKDPNLWHQRLGHVHEQRLRDIHRKELVTGMDISSTGLTFCKGCVEGKMHRKPFKPVGEIRSTKRLQLVHTDVCGPMQTESLGGRRYFVTFTDDYTRSCAVYFMRKKDEVFEKFREYEAAVTNQSEERIGTLRSDNGGEYLSGAFDEYLKSRGIRHELTVPHTPEQNGVAERINRTLMESARAMLRHAGLPNMFWAEAVSTAAYLRNRLPSRAFKQSTTPYELWCKRKPNVGHLRVFGCRAYAHIPDAERRKLDKKAEALIFVGYSLTSKGYRLFDQTTRKLVVRRDVSFNEAVVTQMEAGAMQKELGAVNIIDADSQGHTQEGTIEDENVQEPRKSGRLVRPPTKYGYDEYAGSATTDTEVQHLAYISQVTEPATLKEALESNHSEEWRTAADAEYQSLIENDTWKLMELPSGRKTVGCKWVFRTKHGSDGRVERFKARLVARGFTQQYGIDYEETFSPVVRFTSVRALLAHGLQHGMTIHQMDVVTAFLNGNLDEDIFMQQPDGYVQTGQEHLVCKLNKSLYGLKQSPRCWNAVFHEYMEHIGFKQGNADPCVYTRSADVTTIIAVYVDDLIMMSETTQEMVRVKGLLSDRFKMKDMGELHYCLGIAIEQCEHRQSLLIHQSLFIQKILAKYKMSEANTVATPADLSVRLVKNDGLSKPVDQGHYQAMVGSLLYAAIATRPDIAQAVGVVAKFSSNPDSSHLTAVKRIYRYLKGSVNLGLRYTKQVDGQLITYSDADWAGDHDNRHSTTGNLHMMAEAAIGWLSKKQRVVALSTSEAEYIALSTAAQETIWLRRLLKDLNAGQSTPTTIMEDNQGAIAIAQNPVSHNRTKHIDIRYHFIRETVQSGEIRLHYCPTKDMIADLLTKPLSRQVFELLRSNMGMADHV